MGPRLFRRGNVVARLMLVRDYWASMGPRLFRRGNSSTAPPAATMGDPLQWGHAFSDVEISDFRRERWRHVICFNGATPFQTWKCRGGGVELRRLSPLQWGHAFSDVEILGGPATLEGIFRRFNGATPFQTWKWRCLDGETPPPDPASMGPRLFRRGNRNSKPGRSRT